MGTPIYMAPEALHGKRIPFKSDIYSLGIILHFMIVKEVPDYYEKVVPAKFNLPIVYSQDLLDLLTSLLKVDLI